MNPDLWNQWEALRYCVPQAVEWYAAGEEEYVGEIPTRKILCMEKGPRSILNLEVTEEQVQETVARVTKFFNMWGEEVKPKKVFSTWMPLQDGKVELKGFSMSKSFTKEQLLDWINQSKKGNVDYSIGEQALEGMIW